MKTKIKHDCKDCKKSSEWHAKFSKGHAKLSKEYADACRCKK